MVDSSDPPSPPGGPIPPPSRLFPVAGKYAISLKVRDYWYSQNAKGCNVSDTYNTLRQLHEMHRDRAYVRYLHAVTALNLADAEVQRVAEQFPRSVDRGQALDL